MTGRHQGPKQKLRAGYRALSLKWTSHVALRPHRFLCAMRVFKVRASSSSPRLPLCQILFLPQPPLLSVFTHSLIHPPSLTDAPGTEAFALEQYWHTLLIFIFQRGKGTWDRPVLTCCKFRQSAFHTIRPENQLIRSCATILITTLQLDDVYVCCKVAGVMWVAVRWKECLILHTQFMTLEERSMMSSTCPWISRWRWCGILHHVFTNFNNCML